MTPTFVMCGDSLTQFGANLATGGFMCLLSQYFVRKADVINRGYSGYTTKTFLQEVVSTLHLDFTIKPPQLWTLWLGANDAAIIGGKDGDQHVPVDVYGENLKLIVRELVQISGDSKVLLITPPALIDDMRPHDSRIPDRTNEETGKYAKCCAEVGAELAASNRNVVTLNVYDSINAIPLEQRRLYYTDGLHFSASGNLYIASAISNTITQLFPELRL